MKNQSKKLYKTAHTPNSSKGLGDFYGTGIVAKIGKMRSGSVGMEVLSAKKLGKPPRSVA